MRNSFPQISTSLEKNNNKNILSYSPNGYPSNVKLNCLSLCPEWPYKKKIKCTVKNTSWPPKNNRPVPFVQLRQMTNDRYNDGLMAPSHRMDRVEIVWHRTLTSPNARNDQNFYAHGNICSIASHIVLLYLIHISSLWSWTTFCHNLIIIITLPASISARVMGKSLYFFCLPSTVRCLFVVYAFCLFLRSTSEIKIEWQFTVLLWWLHSCTYS